MPVQLVLQGAACEAGPSGDLLVAGARDGAKLRPKLLGDPSECCLWG